MILLSRALIKHKPAPLCDRCVAYLIDYVIAGAISWACGAGCIYAIVKDGIRDGVSIGKGMMGLRVVKHGTRQGGTITNSCLRNCCNLCPPLCCCTSERRHFGDYIGGTVVVKDR